MLSSLRVLHPPSSDNPTNLPVLVFSVDNKQYLFNAPEGLTRVLIQRGTRGATKNLQGVFVPRVSSDACGGLPGFIMSMADQTRSSMQLCGPPVLAQLLATARSYTHRGDFRLQIREVDLESSVDGLQPSSSASNGKAQSRSRPGEIVVQDDDVTIVAVPLLPQDYALPSQQSTGSHLPSSAKWSDKPQSKKQKQSGEGRRNRFGATEEVTSHLNAMFATADPPTLTSIAEMGGDAEQKNFRPKAAGNIIMQAPALAPVTLEEADAADGQAPVLLYIIKNNAKRGRLDADRARSQGLADPRRLRELTAGKDVEVMRPKAFAEWEELEQRAWLSNSELASRRAANLQYSKRRRPLPKALEPTEDSSRFDGIEMEAYTIRSSDVLAPSVPGTTVAQIYLPSVAYLPSFLHETVQAYFDELDEDPHVLVHAVHPLVLQDARYQSFVKRFKKTHHIITTRSYVPDLLAYSSSAMTLLRMSYLDEGLFSVPPYSLTPQRKLEDVFRHDYDSAHVQVASTDVTVGLHPRQPPKATPREIDFEFSLPLDAPEIAAAASYRSTATPAHNAAQNQQRWSKYLELVSHLQEEESQREASLPAEDARKTLRITTLGTGSSLPSKYRNVSATLLHLPNDGGYVLLDAGEGTYGQLCRKFGGDVDDVLARIRMIFLSHTHGDHHMGMTTLLTKRKQLRHVDGPLFVLSNSFTRNYLLEVNAIQPLGICALEASKTASEGVVMLDNEHFNFYHGVEADPEVASLHERDARLDADLPPTQEGRWSQYGREEIRRVKQRSKQAASQAEIERIVAIMQASKRAHRDLVHTRMARLQSALGGANVYTMDVDHRGSRCYGIVLRHNDAQAPWSVAYSGDTRPCAELAHAGAGVEVLVHEATFEDGQEEMADAKGHSTVGQAVGIARAIGAKRLLLTHFSQRYPKLPRIVSGGGVTNGKHDESTPSVGISFDMMTVSVRDIGKTERYREALQVLFDDGEGGAEEADAAGEAAGEAGEEVAAAGEQGTSAQTLHINGKERNDDVAVHRNATAADESMDTGKVASGQSLVQRAVVKEHEFVYAIAILAPARSGQSKSLPTRLAFDDALRHALEEMHGLIGASFSRDLLLFDGSGGDAVVRIVIKVASPFAQTLSSTLAMGVAVDVAAQPTAHRFVTKFAGLLSAYDLVAVHGMTNSIASSGRAWLHEVAKAK